MIKHTAHRMTKPAKKLVDPLFVLVILTLIFVPVLNACSTTPRSSGATQIDTSNIDTNTLKLPDGYEWDGEEDDMEENEETSQSSFTKGTTMSFRADRNAPTATRLAAIEDQLELLRQDFNELYPSMRRLMAIEQDMQELIMELKSLTTDVAAQPFVPPTGLSQTLTKEQALAQADEMRRRAQQQQNNDAMIPPAMPAPANITQPPGVDTMPAPTPQTASAPVTPAPTPSAPASGPINATVTQARIGIHSDIVRVVLDYTNGSTVTFDKSQNGQVFDLYLPNTSYNGRTSWQSEFVPMVTSYSVQQNGSDTTIKFNLEPGISLKSAFVIPPKSAAQNPRLVIDFTE